MAKERIETVQLPSEHEGPSRHVVASGRLRALFDEIQSPAVSFSGSEVRLTGFQCKWCGWTAWTDEFRSIPNHDCSGPPLEVEIRKAT